MSSAFSIVVFFLLLKGLIILSIINTVCSSTTYYSYDLYYFVGQYDSSYSGPGGYSGDGGQATSATLNYPTGVALDTSGNVYVADTENNVIRMVTISTGNIISTIAGTGNDGYSGDGGQATAAMLDSPNAVAVDSSGNVYIADYRNHRIRKVTVSTDIIDTIAGTGTSSYSGDGGQATSATLSNPSGIAVDSSGNVYIADTNNNRIRKVTVSTDIIDTIAGTGTSSYSGDGGQATSATLSYPNGIAVDSSGNVYIIDRNNYRIRKVTVSTGIIDTIAGNGTSAYTINNFGDYTGQEATVNKTKHIQKQNKY